MKDKKPQERKPAQRQKETALKRLERWLVKALEKGLQEYSKQIGPFGFFD